jgi:3-hydroxyacyl-CoA dehydrogenase
MGLVEGASRSRLCFDPEITRAVAGCAFVQENGPERVDVKRDLLAKISAAVPSDSLIATISCTKRPRKAPTGRRSHAKYFGSVAV